jgi:hypothetical protein
MAVMWGEILRFERRSIHAFGQVLRNRRVAVVRAGVVLFKVPGVVSWGIEHLIAVRIQSCWLVMQEGLRIMGEILLRTDVGVERIVPVGERTAEGQHERDGGIRKKRRGFRGEEGDRFR